MCHIAKCTIHVLYIVTVYVLCIVNRTMHIVKHIYANIVR